MSVQNGNGHGNTEALLPVEIAPEVSSIATLARRVQGSVSRVIVGKEAEG